jgi:hypothetical protein
MAINGNIDNIVHFVNYNPATGQEGGGRKSLDMANPLVPVRPYQGFLF